jgi:hypothetical protein
LKDCLLKILGLCVMVVEAWFVWMEEISHEIPISHKLNVVLAVFA